MSVVGSILTWLIDGLRKSKSRLTESWVMIVWGISFAEMYLLRGHQFKNITLIYAD